MTMKPQRFATLVVAIYAIVLASPSTLSPQLGGNVAAVSASIITAAVLLLGPTRGYAYLPVAIIPFLVWAFATSTSSLDMEATMNGITAVLAIGFAAVVVAAKLAPANIARALTYAGMISLVLSVVLYVRDPASVTSPVGITGIFGHKNIFGFVLAVAFTATIARTGRRRWVKFLTIAALVGGVVWARSSTALIAMGVVLVAWYAITRFQSHKLSRAQKGLTVFALVGAAIAAATVTFVDSDILLTLLGKTSTLSARTTIWAAIQPYIDERPGIGWGYAAPWVEGSILASTVQFASTTAATHAHSGYLDIVLQTGWLGLALYLVFFVSVSKRSWSAMRTGTAASAFPVLIVVLMVLSDTVESRFFHNLGWFSLILSLCVATGVVRAARRSKEDPAKEPIAHASAV